MLRCDFCYDEHVTHIVPARSFVTSFPNAGSDGDWSACELCANLIQKNDWNGLVIRVRISWERRAGSAMPAEAVTMLRITYRLLRKNITGPIRPI